MQYVGRFVSSVYNTITPNINPATLSGAIDVIVVERQIEIEEEDEDEDATSIQSGTKALPSSSSTSTSGAMQSSVSFGISSSAASTFSLDSRQTGKKKRKRMVTEMASTPFHVRFGKMSVLRPAERKVTLHLNNSSEPLPFAMKVGEAGEAFFVFEVDPEGEGGVPPDLVTSPVLSAMTSPVPEATISSSGHDLPVRSSSTADVESLDLGEPALGSQPGSTVDSASGTSASEDRRTSITTPDYAGSDDGTARSPSPELISTSSKPDATQLKENKDASDDQPGDLPLPADSGPTGSGPHAGSGSLLDSVGDAASRASGAITNVIKGSIGVSAGTQLEGGDGEGDDDGSKAGRKLDGADDEHHPSEGKEKLQEADDDHPPEHGKANKGRETDMERLEREMRDQTEQLIKAEREAKKLEELFHRQTLRKESEEEEPTSHAGEVEEAYPAPFGEAGKEGIRPSNELDLTKGPSMGTFPVSQAAHVDFLGGQRHDPIVAENGHSVHAAQIDVRTVKADLEANKKAYKDLKQKLSKSDEDKEPGTKEKERKAELNRLPVNQLKEQASYMFDMDGYKMTADGEDLAFAEGQRLANELPLSRRHGGRGRQGHSERLDKPHRHPNYLDNANALDASADDLHSSLSKKGSGDLSARSRVQKLKRGSVDDDAISVLSSDSEDSGFLHSSVEGAVAFSARQLSRDLVRLARMNEVKTDPSSGRQNDDGSDSSEDGSVPEGVPRQRRNSSHLSDRPRDYSLARQLSSSRKLGHVQEASISDSETTRAPSTARAGGTSQHLRAKSGPSHQVPGDATPARGLPADRAQSPEYDWAWGEMPKRREGDPRDSARVRATSMEAMEFSERLPAGDAGQFTHLEGDPYVFQLQLNEAVHQFQLSLCWGEGFGNDAAMDEYEFEENRVSYERFLDDADLVNDVRLVLKYDNTMLTWENASTIMATLSLYRQSLPIKSLQQDLGPAGGEMAGSRWRRWWNRSSTIPPAATTTDDGPQPPRPGQIDRASTDTELLLQKQASAAGQTPKPPAAADNQKVYAKTLRLTSDQLKSLNLKKGANTITFSVTSSYSGVATCTARIFLWEAAHQVVVSDIDGTITKSDALGHVFTMIGRDWTHQGVAKLYTDIARNGYRIMYLTSRAIGQADTTRDYLRGIKQDNYQLPDGPVIMSPDRLIASLHREVILRKPEVFKMACLRDISRLFGSDPRALSAAKSEVSPSAGSAANQIKSNMTNPTPFYAGFGNRITDALSYRSVNIPSSRIFTIDTNGEVKMELLEMAGYKSSYIHMTDLVDQMFPPITVREELNPRQREYNDFNYWRAPLADVELPTDEDLQPSNPVSPALSARSGRSVRSTRSGVSGNQRMDSAEMSPSSPPQGSRLSRFGLGSLGLGRRTSASQSQAPANEMDRTGRKGSSDANPPPQRSATVGTDKPATSNSAGSPATSYGSGGSGWAAPWRRRAASPSASSQASMQATSPLVGPVITAEPESDGEHEGESDDDVSSLEGDEEDHHLSEDEGDDFGHQDIGEDVLDDDDPLLAQGEIRFEWRG